MSGKFTDVMKAAKDEKQKDVKDERQIVSKDDRQKASLDDVVNVCIKIPRSVRKRWTMAATQSDMTLKDWIMDAIEKHYF
jgi:predicted HicB family RNase H-like nuclease